MAARTITLDTPEELAVIGHLRSWCHDTSVCGICVAERRTESIISG